MHDSDDDSLTWIRTFQDPRIIVYYATGINGIAGNWARIREVVKNEFMTIIGYDDQFHPNYLEVMDRLILDHPEASLYQTHFNFIDKDGKLTGRCKPMPEKQTAEVFLDAQLNNAIDSTATGYMMRSEDYDKMGGIPLTYPNLLFADYHLWIELIRTGYLATSEKICFDYRMHASVSKVTNGEAYRRAFELYADYLLLLGRMNNTFKEVITKSGKRFLMLYCEGISHRLLKTTGKERTGVADFIDECKKVASLLIPGQSFEPLRNRSIWFASLIDRSEIGRTLFQWIKRIRNQMNL